MKEKGKKIFVLSFYNRMFYRMRYRASNTRQGVGYPSPNMDSVYVL